MYITYTLKGTQKASITFKLPELISLPYCEKLYKQVLTKFKFSEKAISQNDFVLWVQSKLENYQEDDLDIWSTENTYLSLKN